MTRVSHCLHVVGLQPFMTEVEYASINCVYTIPSLYIAGLPLSGSLVMVEY